MRIHVNGKLGKRDPIDDELARHRTNKSFPGSDSEFGTGDPANDPPEVQALRGPTIATLSENGAHDEAAGENLEAPGFQMPGPGELWNDPHRLARLFSDLHRTQDGRGTLCQWRDEFHEWNGSAWSPIPDVDFDAKLARFCREVFVADLPKRFDEAQFAAEDARKASPGKPPKIFPVTSSVKANVRLNLSGLVNHPDKGFDPPLWLPGGLDCDPADVISAPNGLFTLEDIASGRQPFATPTPTFFTPNALPFAVPQTAPTPSTWRRCLDEWFSGDSASIAGLQQWFAYLLSSRTNLHKVLLLVGPRRSGKGSILRILTDLIGSANVASTTFAALGESFGLEGLLGKRVAIIPDARLSGRSDTAAIVERLLSISGEDSQSVNRKNRQRVTTRLRCRFVLASNEIPRLPDASGALESRFHILSTPNSFLGKEDLNLGEKLAVELPGILHWASQGWLQLRNQGMRFTQNDAAEHYYRELADLSSPIGAFIRQCCFIGPEHQVEIPVLYRAWFDWNKERNREVSSEQVFGRDMRAALPHLRTTQPRKSLGIRTRTYEGIGLKASEEWGEPEPPARDGTRANPTYAKEKLWDEEEEAHVSSARVPSRASDDSDQSSGHMFGGTDLSALW